MPASHPLRKARDQMAKHIRQMTGYEPVECPWRAFFDPLVREVSEIAILASDGVGMAALGDQPPAPVVDALPVYMQAKAATRAHDIEQDNERRKAERKKGS